MYYPFVDRRRHLNKMKVKDYLIRIRKTRAGLVIGYHETIVKTDKPPKVGDKQTFILTPPITETIISVEEIKSND